MTIERETAVPAEDLHPRRPDMIERMTRHMLCCVYWRVAAGSCDKSNQAAGKGGSAAQPQADTESGSAQWIDYTTAFKRLTFLERKVLQVVINHGPVDRLDGDPGGRLANGRDAAALNGTHFDDAEVFWRHYAHMVGSYDWQTLADTEEMAYRHMARTLGWRPPQSQYPR